MEYLLYGLSYDALSQLERLDGDLIVEVPAGRFTLGHLLDLERQEARSDCGDWRTWSLSAWLASRGGA